MPTHGRRVLSCGLVIVAVALTSASVFEQLPADDVSAGSPQSPLSVEKIAPPESLRMHGRPEVHATGTVVTLSPNPSPEGTGPTPGDPPFDPNVRVWGDANEQSRPTMAVNPVNDHTYVAFQHFNGADWDIYLSSTTDVGSAWTTVPMAIGPGNEMNPSLAVTPAGHFALFYQDDSDVNREFFFFSADGTTWSGWSLNINGIIPELTDFQFPIVTAQNGGVTYPDGVMWVYQAMCSSPTNCGGGAHTTFWLGTETWNAEGAWTFNLGGTYWLVDAAPGGSHITDPLHPSLSWNGNGLYQGIDEETTDGAEWRLMWVKLTEDGTTVENAWLSTARSSEGVFSDSDVFGLKHVIAGTFIIPPAANSVIIYFFTGDGGASYGSSQLDAAATTQRSISLVAATATEWHITYYSDAIVTHQVSTNSGASFNGAEKVSDNAGTAVNDVRATSVSSGMSGTVIAWQDNRDGDTNIYATVGVGSGIGNDTAGPITRYPMTIPNPYIKDFSTSLEVVAYIDDSYTGHSNITAAQLVLTDTTVSDPSAVDWTKAWVMNLTGIDRNPVERAWLWANETAAGWPVGSCHRFWIRGQDSRSNWGTGAYADVCVVVVTPGFPRPPIMTKAELTGSGYGDVSLMWASSPDDGGGLNDVNVYKVSRSGDIRGTFVVVANVTATKSAFYTWTDRGAGHGNLRDFFYHVVASTPFNDSLPTRLAGKFSRSMSGGKQLLSFPLEQADYNISIVFQTFDFTYSRTYVAGIPNPWWCHKPGRFINSLTELSILQGYWVELDGPGTMTVAGLVPENVVMHLKSGWNMMGFPSFNEAYTFADLDTAIGGMLQLVEIYDPAAGPYYLQKVHRSAWPSTYMETGFAYMVRVSSDVDWLVPSS